MDGNDCVDKLTFPLLEHLKKLGVSCFHLFVFPLKSTKEIKKFTKIGLTDIFFHFNCLVILVKYLSNVNICTGFHRVS